MPAHASSPGSPSTESEGAGRAEGVDLAVMFGILVGTALVALWNPFWEHSSVLISAFVTASGCWAVAVHRARTRDLPLKWIVLGAVMLRGLALLGAPELSDDLNRYVWEGALVSEGVSPYAHAPNAAELVANREALPEVYEGLNNPDVSAAYPPAIQLVFGGVVRALSATQGDAALLASGTLAFRLLFSLCDLLVLWPLASLLKRFGRRRSLLVVWGWCPLVVLEFAGSGHFDSLGILTLLATLALWSESRPDGDAHVDSGKDAFRSFRHEALGALLLSASIFVKLLPLCAVPFALRNRAFARRAALLSAGCLLWLAPFLFWEGGLQSADRGLTEYGTRWEGFNFVYSWIESAVESLFGGERDRSFSDPRLVGRAVIALIWIGCAGLLWKRGASALRATESLIALFLFLTPTLHPWYLAWLVPFLALRVSWAWTWVVCVAALLYLPLTRWNTEGVWVIPGWSWSLVAIPFAVLFVIEWRREQDLQP